VIEKPPFFMKENGQEVIHINFNSAQIDSVYFPQLNVVGDIATTINRLARAITPQETWEFDYFNRVRDEVKLRISKHCDDERFPVLPQSAVKLIRTELDDDSIVALDNGVYKIWFARNYPAYENNTVLLDNALATMGAGLPSAMMAKMINPERKVVAVCGDGGFMMNSQEMETAVRLGLDLVVVILNDSAYGMIKWKQEGMAFDNFGLDYNNPDFVKYAESYGATGHRPTSHSEFREVFKLATNSTGVHLIDLAVDYSLNHAILNVALKEKACLL
jgi:acetolactate synthase-1/2/3 large subunit